MLDKLPPYLRHLVIIVVPLILAWGIEQADAWNLPFGLAGLIAAVLGALVLWFTTVTKQYGVGSEPPADGESDG